MKVMSRVPVGVQLNGGWLLVGTIMFMSGLGFASGVTESTTITKLMGDTAIHVWGGVLMTSGALLGVAIWFSRVALEKLALNLMSIALSVYGAWLAAAVPFSRTGLTITLLIIFVGLAQIRVAVLRRLLRPLPRRDIN